MPRVIPVGLAFLVASFASAAARSAEAIPALTPVDVPTTAQTPSTQTPPTSSTQTPSALDNSRQRQREGLEETRAAPARIVSITFSPIHLQYPMVEFMGEIRLIGKSHRAFAMAFIAGYGQLSQAVERNKGLVKETRYPRAGQFGGQLLYYPLDDFRSLQVGTEAMYVKYLGFDLDPEQSVSSLGDGLSFGFFLGYKHLSSNGLTFSGQLGADYMTKRNHPDKPATGKVNVTPSRWFPLLNVNVGWSF